VVGVFDVYSRRLFVLALGLPFFFFQWPGNAQEAKPTTPAASVDEMAPADDLALELALSAYEQGDLLKAERLLRSLAQRYPANFTVTETLGLVYAERGDFASAIPLLEKACTLRSSSALAFANLGAAYLKDGRNRDARRALARAAALDPANPRTQSNLGQALAQAGLFRQAAEAFQAAARASPADPDILYNWAFALFREGDFDRAAEVLVRLPSIESSPTAQSLLGDIDEKRGHFEDAVQHLKQAATLDPSEQNIYTLGVELARHWNFKSAAEIFTYGISKYPESARLQVGLGVSKYGNNDYAGASSVFSHLLARDPDNTLYADFLGRSCSLTAAEGDGGCQRLTDFAERHPQNASAACYAAAGILHRPVKAQDLELARHLLQQAIAAEPKLAKAYFEMGVLEQQEMHWRESVAPLERAVALDPEFVEAHYRLARAYARIGKQEQAQREIVVQQKYSRQKKENVDARLRDLKTFLITLH
jgi:tetratricopeptide (TPR) repeat protein